MPVSESKKLLQKTRRENGLCINCGNPANGKSRCVDCAAKQKASRQKAAARKKAAGVCQNTGCHKPAKPGKTVCVDCAAQATAASKQRYESRKNTGKCAYCSRDAVRNNRCQACLDSLQQAAAKLYEDRKSNNLCSQCGKQPSREGKVLCEECTPKRAAHNKSLWYRRRFAAFEAYGGAICVGCNEDDVDILELDHIDGGGNDHRREIGQSGLYKWLEDNDYPPGFRVLCPTCNKKAHKGKPLPNQ